MVAVRTQDADRFLAQRRSDTFLYLFHGPDSGLVRERARLAARRAVDDPDDPFAIVRLDGDDALREPGRLSDEARAIGLFGGRKAVWVEVGQRAILPALEPLIEDPPVDCTIVLEAGALKKGAPLRALVERLQGGASIECYPDDEKAIARLIDDEARAAGLSVDPKARDALVDLLGADRMATRAELGKLMMYASGDRVVTTDHVEAIVSDASAPASDDAMDGAFLGRTDMVEEPARRAFADGMDPGFLIGQALRHAAILHRIRLDIESGRPRAEATMMHGRAVHFKRHKRLEQQVGLWSADALARAIEALADALPRIRREHRLGDMIAVRALWQTAKIVERR